MPLVTPLLPTLVLSMMPSSSAKYLKMQVGLVGWLGSTGRAVDELIVTYMIYKVRITTKRNG